ncbi:aspartyl protease family protein [Sphingomonas sp. BGYR3]|uniref:aspartyl protease family protein n=1 Tax=Sphingomonas sp. BGYR3 TaxID=2975483 RepID=UPI0021A2FB84|nr:aspartyl protease family protein [Sphingomonas sp. BGYR3]MDG5489512.1 aspartyl protease family protein [Sphingomonas sp. BGYR3]
MRLIFALALLFLAIAPARAQDSGWIDFQRTPGNQIAFEMTVAGHPVTALLDTGASHSVIDQRFAAHIGLPLGAAGRANAIGGTVPIRWSRPLPVVIGTQALARQRLAVLPLPASASGNGAPVHMILGADILGRHALDLDFAARRFRLLPSGRLTFPGLIAPLRAGYVADLALADTRLGAVLMDTGDGAALTLTQAAWAAGGFRHDGLSTTIGWGAGGRVATGLAIIDRIDLAGQAVRQIEARIEPEGGYTASRGLTGRIGAGLMQRYRLLLDPGAGRMVLAQTEPDTSPLRSTSGLLLGRTGERLTVLHVMRGSPAERSGFRADDAICSIDGAGAQRADLSVLAGMPGRSLSIGLCDGGERQLVLSRFY